MVEYKVSALGKLHPTFWTKVLFIIQKTNNKHLQQQMMICYSTQE